MKQNIAWRWVLAILAGVILAWVLPAAGEDEELVVLIGTVVIADWDENGEVIAIDIQTDDEGTFAIALEGAGQDLLSYVDQRVEIEGWLFDGEDGWTYVQVQRFAIARDPV